MAAVSATTPFTDPLERFTVELPTGWSFAPLPGDTTGVSFRRELDGVPANFSVRLLRVKKGTGAAAVAADLARLVQKQPGYRIVAEELDSLAGRPAFRRRYVVNINGDVAWPKMVEIRVAVHNHQAYVLHAETLAEAFGVFEKDFKKLFASFHPRDVAKTKAPSLAGRWRMQVDANVLFELSEDGRFILGDVVGIFRVVGQQLITQMPNGAEETFTWKITDDMLTLSSANLDEPIVYRRADK